MSDSDAKNAWIKRVLGLEVAAGPAADPAAAPIFPALWQRAVDRWQAANDTVDGQVSQLQRALLDSDDDELHEIAEFGLNGVTGGTKVGLMAAIRDISGKAGALPPALAANGRKAVLQFQQQIATDSRIDACEDNPFGVTVAIRSTFAPALAGLDSALKSATNV